MSYLKEIDNIIDFTAEKILYDLEKEIKSLPDNDDSLECIKTAKAILRGKIPIPD
jgi:hypothetical protein